MLRIETENTEDRALLSDFSTDDLSDMRSCDFTDEQITSMIGGCIPLTMVFDTLLLTLQSLQALVLSHAVLGPVLAAPPEDAHLISAERQTLPVAPASLPPASSLVLA